jgi:hypothetical protein
VQLAPPAPRPAHQRLTVLAAAVSVLLVLAVPAVVGTLLGLVAPVDHTGEPQLTQRAEAVAELPGANVIGDQVIVTLTPEMNAPVMRLSQQVLPEDSAGELVPLGVSGLLPMNQYVAPAGTGPLVAGLWPGDQVFSNLGPLVVGCLLTAADPPDACTPTLLTEHHTGYFRYPGTWGSASFLEDGTAMEADVYDVVGGQVVVGGAPGTDIDRVEVRTIDGARVSAFTTTSASPGDVIWWAASPRRPVAATAYDAKGRVLEKVDLDG